MTSYKNTEYFVKWGRCAVAVLVLSLMFVDSSQAGPDATQKVNPQLAKRAAIYKPALIKLGDRVHAVFGYEYSNYGYIEGDDGVIVVDTGWYPGQAKRSIADYRKTVTDKPIVAIIYTHSHIDHYGGASSIMEGQSKDIPVYAPKGFERYLSDEFGVLRPEMARRAFKQMGLLLPLGEDGSVGNALGAPLRAEGIPELSFPPTIYISEPTELVISGVRMRLMIQAGDMPENLFIWLPDDKVLFIGDATPHGVFPALETVRFEAERDPRQLIESADRMLEMSPDYVIPGHGRLLLGADDVREVGIANRDIIEFMVDQIDRLYVKGYSADQIVDTLKLPPQLAVHPDLQPYYHRVEWMIKIMHLKRGGFAGETMDLVTLTKSEEAKRLVPLLGGAEEVRKQAKAALDANDPRWAARLATYAMKVSSDDNEARKIRQDAFLRIARTTMSANERNYLLTTINEENGKINWKAMLSKSNYKVAKAQDLDHLLRLMKARFRAEAADNLKFIIKVTVSGQSPRYYQVRNNVLILREKAPGKVDASLSMDRDVLDRIVANMTTWSEALADKQIKIISGNSSTVKKLADLIE